MNYPRELRQIWPVVFILTCLTLASCAKKVTPEQARQARLDWNLKTLVAAYKQSGNTGAAWDEPAGQALEEFSRSRSRMLGPNEDLSELIGMNCAAAINAGCDDPMIRYLHLRNSRNQASSPKAYADAMSKVADDLQDSSYPPIRKFYAALRAADQLNNAAPDRQHTPADVHNYRHLAMNNLAETLVDKTMPIGEVDDACHEMFRVLEANPKEYEDCYHSIEGSLFKNWPDQSAVWLIKGEANIREAWFARGSGYADTVSAKGWQLFEKHLNEAEKSFAHAWKLNPKDPRIAVMMMRVELGQGKGRERMELWFDRAMELDQNNYDTCNWKLFYLEPKWHGSRDEMVDFGRECVTATNWGGRIPLILADAHWRYSSYLSDPEVKSNYWKLPDVWPDIKASYDRFFEINPDAFGYYHNYAWYAYHAEQWNALNEIIPKLGPINYSYFGGKEEFEKMIRSAKEHAKPSSPPPAASQR